MKYNGYKLVSEISKSNLIISGLSAGKGAVSGNLIGRKIGIRKHNKDLQTARLNVIRIKSELERDPSKIKEVELATERLRSLESPESRKKYIKKYSRYGEAGGSLAGAATGVLAHKAGVTAYKILKKK